MKKSFVVFSLCGVLAFLMFPILPGLDRVYAQWEMDQRLTSGTQLSWLQYNKNIAVGSPGYVHVVWDKQWGGPDSVMYKRSTDNGTTWSNDTLLPSVTNFAGPSIATSGSNVHIVYGNYTNASYHPLYYQRSTNNGASWSVEDSLTSTFYCDYPCIAASGDTVHLVWSGSSSGYLYYKRSMDNGTTWNSDLIIDTTSDDILPSIAVSGANVNVVWSNGDVYFKRSTDSGRSWSAPTNLTQDTGYESVGNPIIASSGLNVYVAWWRNDTNGSPVNHEIFFKRSTDDGATWGPKTRLTYAKYQSTNPSLAVSDSTLYLVWVDMRNAPGDTFYKYQEIYYKRSADGGVHWSPDSRLTTSSLAWCSTPSVGVLDTVVHVIWEDRRDGNLEPHIFYKRNIHGPNGFPGLQTEPSQGRHFVRDASTGTLHLVMQAEDSLVYYTKSTDNGTSWDTLQYLGAGKTPTVGLAKDSLGGTVICVAYKPLHDDSLTYTWYDQNVGSWQRANIVTATNPGPPSLAVLYPGMAGQEVFVSYASGSPRTLKCCYFRYSTPTTNTYETIDATANPAQPCLAVDGNGNIYGAWQRADSNQIWYAPRGSMIPWISKLRVDSTNLASKQPFLDCYGDSVFVVWSDSMASSNSSFDVWRRSKKFSDSKWKTNINVSNSSNIASESPTQAWREFTTWAEGMTTPGFDSIEYWRCNGATGNLSTTPTEWSYWPHSQMNYNQLTGRTELFTAWTVGPDSGYKPFHVLTSYNQFLSLSGPGPVASDFGPYYGVLAGQDTPSVYCIKRDGVLHFSDKAVDFARDSLVYKLPYLDPVYDYYLKVSSYRETGSGWVQSLSVNGGVSRTVQFAPNHVDTAWIRIPPEAYAQDCKVTFAIKNVKGDYVTSLGLTLYQRDPKRGRGPQDGGQVAMPQREVFAVYPNPMNVHAQVAYSLKAPGVVNLAVYDVMGRLVRQVVNESQPAGLHKTIWDGKAANGKLATSGVYFMKLSSPGINKTTRFVVVR